MVQKWKKSIVNHMFWCLSSTHDDDLDLKEAKWLSITNHLTNRHSGHENPLFRKCAHGRLHGRERKKNGAQARYLFKRALKFFKSHYEQDCLIIAPTYTCIFSSVQFSLFSHNTLPSLV